MNAVQEPKNKSLNMESVTFADLTWVNIERPNEADIACLRENYPFHPLDLADCLSKIQRPKLDVYKDYLFLIFHYSIWDKVKRVSSAEQVAVFVGNNYVITAHNGRFMPLVDLFRRCRSDEQVRREHFGNGSGYLVYRIVDSSVDSYFPILDKLLELTDKVEDAVFDENIEAAKEVFILRRDIITQRRIMFPNRTTFSELESKLVRFSKIDLAPHFGDVMDHMNKICETLDECKEIIDAFKDTDYVLSTNRIKTFLRILTILGSIAVPFVVISGIYAMNVLLPGGNKNDFSMFIIIIVIMCLISGSMLYFLRRKRWI
jgi:magnesium transporter